LKEKVAEGKAAGPKLAKFDAQTWKIEDEENFRFRETAFMLSYANNRAKRTPLKGMMNIGLRPTVSGTKGTIEVNISILLKTYMVSNVCVCINAFTQRNKKNSADWTH